MRLQAQATISSFLEDSLIEFRRLAREAGVESLCILGPKDEAVPSAPPGVWWSIGKEKWGPGQRFGQAGEPSALWTRAIPIYFHVFGGEQPTPETDKNDPQQGAGTYLRETDATEALVELLVNAFQRRSSMFSYQIDGADWGKSPIEGLGMACDLDVLLRLPLVRIDNPIVTLRGIRTTTELPSDG